MYRRLAVYFILYIFSITLGGDHNSTMVSLVPHGTKKSESQKSRSDKESALVLVGESVLQIENLYLSLGFSVVTFGGKHLGKIKLVLIYLLCVCMVNLVHGTALVDLVIKLVLPFL